jgi:septal ring factor EnvC (AmiA/AmiB activator)
MTTLERSHSCTSSTSLSMSSPRPSRRETTPPGSELSLFHLHDRMNQLDSRVLELRSTVLTKDGYVDRRNREDEHIRREFEAHRAISHRIDLNVVALRSDVDQIKTSIFQLKTSLGQSGTETVFLRGDVDRMEKSVDQLHVDLEQIRTESCATRIDISKLQSASSQLRTDLVTIEHKLSRQMKSMEHLFNARMDSIESRMRHSDRVRFNSLAHTILAPISPVPVITNDGALEWPKYFPRTVWKFWCLKKRSRGTHK